MTAKLSARFLLFTNELPRLNDASGALPGRMILLRLTQSWYGKEDTSLTDAASGRIARNPLWAIAGWQRLRDRGHFVQPDASRDMIDDLADLASPVGAFVRERASVGPGAQVERSIAFRRLEKLVRQSKGERPSGRLRYIRWRTCGL